ncbi:DMT family transporter [Aquipuribacter nitratireducens]|uniref:DMT family transporter n=1 Tax=Aquipuribacter nitratireducens TaxID=650104 RepID=A0ABW0GN51_9MICO
MSRRTRQVLLGLVGTVAVGVLVAAQSRVNGELAPRFAPSTGPDAWWVWRGPADDAVAAGIDAAVLSFAVGWLIVLVGTLVQARGRHGMAEVVHALRDGSLRWWMLLGGLGGATFIAGQGIAVPVLGVSVFVVATVAGVTVGGLLVDRFGLAPGGARPYTARRVIGCVLAVGGVAFSVSGSLDGGIASGASVLLFSVVLLACLPMGALTAAQQAVNGRVAQRSRTPWVAGLGNFTAGLAALLLARLLLIGTVAPGPLPDQWWLWLSGPIGLSFILLGAVLVRTLGVLLLSLGNTGGQLVGSIAIDELFPTAAGRPGLVELVAAVVIFVAVALAASRPRRRPAPPGPAGPPTVRREPVGAGRP